MFKRILNMFRIRLINRSSTSKVKYLRKMGCKIGENNEILCHTSAFGTEPYLIEVGSDCLFSGQINLLTHDGGVKVLNSLGYFDNKRMDKIGKIKIGNNCFIGVGVKVMPGVTIGNNVIIGAGSIVTKNVPNDSVIAGIPAKVMCSIDDYYHKNKQQFYDTTGIYGEEKKVFILDALSTKSDE